MKDAATKAYMEQSNVFADAFNFFIYGGEPVIDPSRLRELGTAELSVPYGADGTTEPVEKIRDVMRSVTAMTDDENAYLLLGIENQSEVHYAMPVKNMCYDALRYDKQVEQSRQSHRKAKDSRGHSSGEYLSGFYKTDRLVPVITLVVFFGADDWDGPLSLHEMLTTQEPRILSLVPDYPIHLIAPARLTDEELTKFHSSLKEVLSFIKYSKNAKKLSQVVNENKNFQVLGRKEVTVLNTCASAGLTLHENEEVFNVCKAIEDMKKTAADTGRTEGLVESIKNLMNNLSWSAEQAMTALGIPAADFSKYLSLL